jgi:group I intron endonuclease
MYSVYLHKLPNNKKYVGITKMEPKIRWRNGNGYKNNVLFYRAILKYNWENIEHTILFTGLTKIEAEQKEIELIKYFKSNNRNYGYNIENGGNVCGTHSKFTRDKISKALKGKQNCLGRKISKWHINRLKEGREHKPPPMLGKHLSDETKHKISIKNKNKIVSEETIKKIGESLKKRLSNPKNNPMYGKHHYIETIEKIRNSKLGKKPSLLSIQKTIERVRRPVIRISKNGEIKKYNSIKSASEELNLHSQNIGFCCKNLNKTIGGYFWRYDNKN